MSSYATRKKDRQETRSLYLERSSSYEIKVSVEGYARILEVIRTMAVCGDCGNYYRPENPQVAGLLCLSCFLENRSHLTYQGPLDPVFYGIGEDRYSSKDAKFSFLDKQGYIHTTQAGPGSNESPTENIAMTLSYWHFPRPEEANRNGKTVKLSDIGWHIYGDVKEDDIVLLQYGSSYYGNEAVFLAKRNGQAIQLTRRKPMHRELLAAAHAELEATYQKEPREGYIIDGELHFYISDEDVYRRIAKRVNQERQTILAQGNEQPEENQMHTEDEEIQAEEEQ